MNKFLSIGLTVIISFSIFNASFVLAQEKDGPPVDQNNACENFTPNMGGCDNRNCPDNTSTRCAASLSGDPDEPCGCHPKCTVKITPDIPCLFRDGQREGQIESVPVRHSECKEPGSSCATRNGAVGLCTNIDVYGPCWDNNGNVGTTNTGTQDAKKLSVCWCLINEEEQPPEEITQEGANKEIPRN